MKLKIPRQKPTQRADSLGEIYEQSARIIKDYSATLEATKASAKLLATEFGKTRGDETTVTGEKYEVGFLEVKPTPTLDEKKVMQLVNPKIWRACLVSRIDPEKLAEAVDAGNLKLSVLRKCFNDGEPSKRIIVRKVRKEEVSK